MFKKVLLCSISLLVILSALLLIGIDPLLNWRIAAIANSKLSQRTENDDAESYNSRVPAECLNREVLYTLSESGVALSYWRHDSNNIGPHRPLG